MSRNLSWVVLAFTFAVDCLLGFLLAPASEISRYGTSAVLFGGVARALGHLVVAVVVIGAWAFVAWIRKRPLPANFGRDSAFLAIAFLAAGIVSRFLS